jgi:hypothetical protein
MTTERDRVISITLTEAEWRAFIARHPQPVDWLLEQIRGELQEGGIAELQDGSHEAHFVPSPPAIL